MRINDDLIQDVARVLTALPARAAYLFGSAAQGTATDDSDVDLAVILDNEPGPASFRQRLARTVAVRRRLRAAAPGIPLDMLVFSADEWAELGRSEPVFAATIRTAGRRIA
jgi:predicted nucleotidyltransferase